MKGPAASKLWQFFVRRQLRFTVLALILFSPNVLANKLSCNTDSIDKFIEAENNAKEKLDH